MVSLVILIAGSIWLAIVLLDIALLLRRSTAGERRRLARRFLPLGLLLVAALLFCLGGWLMSRGWAWTALGTGLAILLGLVAVLLLLGSWSAIAAWSGAALTVFGAGGLWFGSIKRGAERSWNTLASVTFLHSLWLLLLLVIPPLVFLARRSLGLKVRQVFWLFLGVLPTMILRPVVGLRWLGGIMAKAEAWRPWMSVGLRAALFAVLAVALAEPFLRRTGDESTILFVVDRSLSIPEEPAPDPEHPGAEIDLRARRVRNFIVKAVEQRGQEHDRDSVGLIVFGRDPRLEIPPSDLPDVRGLGDLRPPADGTATDIAKALRLAIATFPPDTNKRIVFISDGNENLDRAEDVAREARAKGIEIDVLPLGAGQRNEDEILVERVHTERLAKQGGKIEVTVLVRSHNPNTVIAQLTLKESGDTGTAVKIADEVVRLDRGLNPFVFERSLKDEQRSYSYEAEIVPLRVVDARDPTKVLIEGRPPRDRVQNNKAAAHIVARGRRRVLILEQRPPGKENEVVHDFLVQQLKAAGDKKFQVDVQPVTVLNRDRDKLAAYLSNFDCVVLANVPCDAVTEEQQEELRRNTHDHGCGLIMIGGENGFGSGGWQGTAVEKALPVNSDLKDMKVEGKGGLVLIMHACEMAEGNTWEKKIAKLALDRLGPRDEIGILEFGFKFDWAVDLQEVGPNRAKILAAIDRMSPGDMPEVDTALQEAHDRLTEANRGINAKHIIFVTDGDPQQADVNILPKLRKAGISATTVMVVGHGVKEDRDRMQKIANVTKGRFYDVQDAKNLPAIYIKESRLVSQSFVYEKKFPPVVAARSGPTKNLPARVPDLGGFVRTTAKPVKNVVVPVLTPRFQDGQQFPLLAYWDYGLGKAAAFTSDAGRPKFWSKEWADGGIYGKFWEQVVDWCMRPTESDQLKMRTEVRDGRIIIKIEAETEDKELDTNARVTGRYSVTAGKGGAETDRQRELRFVQKESGVYEAEINAEEAGTYFITARAIRKVKRDGKEVEETEIVRGAETLPLAPEFTVVNCNTPLLERIAAMTGGKSYADDDDALRQAALNKDVFRSFGKAVQARLPLWYWLVFAAGLLLLCDVAVRRIAIDTGKLRLLLARTWARLRGQVVPEMPRPLEIARLQPRRGQAGPPARFEGGPAPVPTPPTLSGPAPSATGPTEPAPPQETEDFTSRLARAKKRIMDERKKDKQ